MKPDQASRAWTAWSEGRTRRRRTPWREREAVHIQLTAQAKQIGDMQRQLDEISAALKNLR